MRHEPKRRLIGPVGIIEHQHQAVLLGEVRHQPVQTVQGPERGGFGVGGCVEQDRRRQRSRPREQGIVRIGACGPDRWLKALPHHAERVVALEFRAARVENTHAPLLSERPRGVEQCRLADARPALDHDRASGAGARGIERGPDPRQLALPLKQKPLRDHAGLPAMSPS
jgi:hypothetical protein